MFLWFLKVVDIGFPYLGAVGVLRFDISLQEVEFIISRICCYFTVGCEISENVEDKQLLL